MKISRNEKSRGIPTGTVYYKCTLDQIIDALSKEDENLWLQYALKEYGWKALNLDTYMFGSKIINNLLYLCKTDGYYINIDGEEVDPEEALDEYPLDKLAAYIQDFDEGVVRSTISMYDMAVVDLNVIAISMLEDGRDYTEITKRAIESGLIED